MKKLLNKILTILVLVFCIGILVLPAESTPIIGKVGSTVHVYLMNQDPDPADSGKYLDLRWRVVVTKVGTIDNLEFYLDAGYPFLFEAGDSPKKSLGKVVPSNEMEEYYVLHYKLKVADNALKGEHNVSLRWNDGSGGYTKKYFTLYVDPSKSDFTIGALRTSPERLVQDTYEALLKADIANIGEEDAENVKASLSLPEGFDASYAYSDEDALGTINESESKTAHFYIDTAEGLQPGDYNATITITYKEDDDEDSQYRTKLLPLNIPIKGSPYLVIESVETSPTEVYPGTYASLLINVKNTGSEEVDAASLRVFKDSTQPFDFDEKSDFIGKLKPGESGEALIRVQVKEDAPPKKYLFDVELRGVETNKDTVVLFSRTAPLVVCPAKESSTSLLLPIISTITAALVVGIVLYKKRKK
ncbi:MAG: hypothetical protein EF812_06570 [Methanosarcinales archaeon]|nr:MAG: hypothetical protein EF812_06570 [Methanosarcinales archaeon]